MQRPRLHGLIMRFEVAERSMEPTLHPGDYVIATGMGRRKRGQVVVFEHPGRRDFLMVKRIIGLDEEEIRIWNGSVFVDGELLEEPWTDHPTLGDGTWKLAKEEIFVLGDYRTISDGDSRQIGPVATDNLMSVRMRYWPSVTRIR